MNNPNKSYSEWTDSAEQVNRAAHSDLSHYETKHILKVEGLIKNFGQRRVVDGVNFYVDHGEVVGLLGPNGAGKTTSFRMTCGILDTNGGTVILNGKDVTNWPMYRRAKEGGMGYLPQDKSVFASLTVQDNLLAVMELLGMDRKRRQQRCDELIEKFDLVKVRKSYAGSGGVSGGLSGGERRRLEIARALVSDPKIILLDEPFANIDPITVHNIQQIVLQLSKEGISILITDHNVRETLQITNRSYVIRAGKVLCHGTPSEVINNEEARKVYFGDGVVDFQPTNPAVSSYARPSYSANSVNSTGSPSHSASVSSGISPGTISRTSSFSGSSSISGSSSSSQYSGGEGRANNSGERGHPSYVGQSEEQGQLEEVRHLTDRPHKTASGPQIPTRPRPQFSHTSNSGRPITGKSGPDEV
ncbi:MAG: LPS export ABC transporter ATP-binding protein [Thermoguttaceae bacterium]